MGNGGPRILELEANWHAVLKDRMNCAFLIEIARRPFRVMRHIRGELVWFWLTRVQGFQGTGRLGVDSLLH